MLTQFEQGDRNLSPEAWARVLSAMSVIQKEKIAERKTRFDKLHEKWMKAFPNFENPLGSFELPEIEAEEQRILIEDKYSLEFSRQISSKWDELLAQSKETAVAYIRKNPGEVLEEYSELSGWRQKILDLEAQGYAFFLKSDIEAKDRRIAELEQELSVLKAKEPSNG